MNSNMKCGSANAGNHSQMVHLPYLLTLFLFKGPVKTWLITVGTFISVIAV